MQEVADIVGDGNDSGQGGAGTGDVDRGGVGIDVAPSEGAGFPDLEAAIVKEDFLPGTSSRGLMAQM